MTVHPTSNRDRAKDFVRQLLSDALRDRPKATWFDPKRSHATAFAPTNIALCKYWGKRDPVLHLPVTGSLSIALPNRGAATTIRPIPGREDVVLLNGQPLLPTTVFVRRMQAFMSLWRKTSSDALEFDIRMSIPVAAGLASSAAGFAALVMAFDQLYDWGLSKQSLSMLARLGSGSAARSLWMGFVEWHPGVRDDGFDSYAEPLSIVWPSLRVGIVTFNQGEKPYSSRDAMQRTVETSPFYDQWPSIVQRDLTMLKEAIEARDFRMLAAVAESNAIAMHATMVTAHPPVVYSLPETVAAIKRIWELREQGLAVYFTQDAGPNLKLLFEAVNEQSVLEAFPDLDIIQPFPSMS